MIHIYICKFTCNLIELNQTDKQIAEKLIDFEIIRKKEEMYGVIGKLKEEKGNKKYK